MRLWVLLLCFVLMTEAELQETARPDEIEAPPKPPNTPSQACERAISQVGKIEGWWCNEFVNWCYFNKISVGGSPQQYCEWPHEATPTKEGTIVCGPSVIAGHWHVGLICNKGTMFCDAPFRDKPIRCVDLSHLKTTFKSYTFHYPPGY